jgi:hypothetical protein
MLDMETLVVKWQRLDRAVSSLLVCQPARMSELAAEAESARFELHNFMHNEVINHAFLKK